MLRTESRVSRTALALVVTAALASGAGCSAATTENAPSTSDNIITVATPRMRSRPTARTMHRALDRVAAEARRCLNAGAPAVIVRGDFMGETGEFQVERVTLTTGVVSAYAVETCVRVVANRARVRPFREESAIFEYTLRATDVDDDVIADGLPAPTTDANPYAARPGGPSAGPGASAAPARPSGSMVGSTLTIQGTPSPLEMIRRDGDAYQRCYEQAAQRDHTVAGEIEMHLRLDAQGHVARLDLRVHSDHDDETLMGLVARCVDSHIRLIQFGPQAQPNVETTARLQFSPSSIPIE